MPGWEVFAGKWVYQISENVGYVFTIYLQGSSLSGSCSQLLIDWIRTLPDSSVVGIAGATELRLYSDDSGEASTGIVEWDTSGAVSVDGYGIFRRVQTELGDQLSLTLCLSEAESVCFQDRTYDSQTTYLLFRDVDDEWP